MQRLYKNAHAYFFFSQKLIKPFKYSFPFFSQHDCEILSPFLFSYILLLQFYLWYLLFIFNCLFLHTLNSIHISLLIFAPLCSNPIKGNQFKLIMSFKNKNNRMPIFVGSLCKQEHS